MSDARARANPYETPTSSLLDVEAFLERRMVVKLYFALATAGVAIRALAASVEPFALRDFVSVAALGISLPGLFGYAYRRPIGPHWLWKLWLPVAIVGAALMRLTFPIDLMPQRAFAIAATTYVHVFDALLCAALYLYAFRSPEIWQRGRS